MNSPECPRRARMTAFSHSLLLALFISLLLVSSASASFAPSAPPPPRRGSSTTAASTAAVAPSSSFSAAARSGTSSSQRLPPFPSATTSTPRYPPTSSAPSLTSLPSTAGHTAQPFLSSSSSSSRPAQTSTVYGSTMSLARMLGLVFVSLLFVVLVISFVWYFWRRQWAAQRQAQSAPLSADGWLRVDERGAVVRDDARGAAVPAQPYQPSMLQYMAASPTPAALTITYMPQADISAQRHYDYVRF